MSLRKLLLGSLAVGAALAGPAPEALGARSRFHYVPVDAAGNTALRADGPYAGGGQRLSSFGTFREVNVPPPRPTHFITYAHPATNQPVTVPVSLPEGTPRIEYRRSRVVYNYGSYTVELLFLADGSVDVIYNSGPFRP